MIHLSVPGVISVGVLLLAIGEAASDDSDWAKCPAVCKCKWISGRRTADCTRQQLSQVPDSLSQEIQFIDLSENQFRVLPSEVFKSVGLVHLQKIYLKECQIQEIHKDAFKHLPLLIELDLTDNRIHTLHSGTFRENVRLRMLWMNKNRLTKLEDGLFTDLTYLQTVEMSDCQLSHIGYKTFINVPNLSKLILDGNKLTHMKLAVVEKLTKLRSLVLHNNPWRCDCHLKAFRDWVVERNLFSQPTSCKEPQNLESKSWIEIESDAFACKPLITWPNKFGSTVIADSEDVTLSCRVTGSPPPEVSWVYNTRIISNDTRTKYGDYRYVIRSSNGETNRWYNLTINKVRPQDKGEFRCVAKSKGGVDEKNVTLVIEASSGVIGTASYGDSWPLILGLIIGLIAFLIIAVVLCCCFCRRKEAVPGKKSPVNGLSPNGEITHHIGASSEQEKSLLTVNPVQKPPRRYDAQTPPNTGTDTSELNRKLLDDGSSIG